MLELVHARVAVSPRCVQVIRLGPSLGGCSTGQIGPCGPAGPSRPAVHQETPFCMALLTPTTRAAARAARPPAARAHARHPLHAHAFTSAGARTLRSLIARRRVASLLCLSKGCLSHGVIIVTNHLLQTIALSVLNRWVIFATKQATST